MTTIDFAAYDLDEPPPGLVDYLNRLNELDVPCFERRGKTRHAVMTTVVAVPVSETGEPTGEGLKAVTRDFSQGGMALLHTRASDATHLAIEIAPKGAEKIQVVMEVLHCRSVGPFYDIGGRFVRKLTS